MRLMDSLTIEEFGIPGRVLMENAGKEAAKILFENFEGILQKKTGIIAGSGNNGGDGFVIARYLSSWGCDVSVYLLANPDKIKGEAKDNLNLLYPMSIKVATIHNSALFAENEEKLKQIDIWVDAILGTGLKSDVRDYFGQVIDFINSRKKPIFAVDIPSGLNSDTGAVCGTAICADLTVTFGFAKTGEKLFPGAKFSGRVEVADIGIPPHIAEKIAPKQYAITENYIKSNMITREADAHKGDSGHILLIAGSRGKTGAALLAAKAAMRTGAGLVTMGICESINSVIESAAIEAMTYALPETKKGTLSLSSFSDIEKIFDGKKCIAIGPGIGTEPETAELVFRISESSEIPLIIDADGLNCIAGNVEILKNINAPVVLTPHPKEMSRLIKRSVREIQSDRVGCAREFACKFGVTLVLKGAGTVVAHKNGNAFINTSGNSGMASGGVGDVLTGIIAGLTAQGYQPEQAANIGVYLHGAAADTIGASIGKIGLIASDIIEAIPLEIKKL